MKFGTGIRRAAAVLLVAVVTACGGGGGGDGGDRTVTPGGEEAAVFEAVSIGLRSPSSLQAQAFDDVGLSAEDLRIDYAGNVDALAGRTLMFVVAMPDPLYTSRPLFYVDLAERVVEVNLHGVPGRLLPGRYTGTLQVYACVDTCHTQLRGSPLSIPYDVVVRPGLGLSQESLRLETTFGTALPPTDVAVTLPMGATDWDFSQEGSPDIAVQRVDDKLVVTPSLFVPPGAYSHRVTVRTSAPDPVVPGTTRDFAKVLDVTYVVRPGAVSYLLHPASASHAYTLGSVVQEEGGFDLLVRDTFVSLSVRGVRFDANPPAAAGHAEVSRWLEGATTSRNAYRVSLCGADLARPDCLPAGTYRAAILYRVATSGADVDFEFPVTMRIVN